LLQYPPAIGPPNGAIFSATIDAPSFLFCNLFSSQEQSVRGISGF
jgi:hypothetical protein